MKDGGPVVFVGAGPGDPELITVAGRRALEAADLVVYAGSLVPPALLDWCRPGAERVDSAPLSLEEAVELMAGAWAAGRRVVRLHTGDPSLYGAVAEQYAALRARGIPYRVVPGVTAALAAAAALGMEHTIPGRGQSLILTRAAGRTPVPPGEDLAALAGHGCGLAVYLSAGRAEEVGRALGRALGTEAPLAVAHRVSWPDQRLFFTTPARLAADLAAAGLGRQVVILAGPGVAAAREGGAVPRSRLYDPAFGHGFRAARPARP